MSVERDLSALLRAAESNNYELCKKQTCILLKTMSDQSGMFSKLPEGIDDLIKGVEARYLALPEEVLQNAGEDDGPTVFEHSTIGAMMSLVVDSAKFFYLLRRHGSLVAAG
jgi:predicted alpha-1,6-mannanase (GH76 family)